METFIEMGNYYLYLHFYKYMDTKSMINFIIINKNTLKNKSFIYKLIFQSILQNKKLIIHDILYYFKTNNYMYNKYYRYNNYNKYDINLELIIKIIKNNKKLNLYFNNYSKNNMYINMF